MCPPFVAMDRALRGLVILCCYSGILFPGVAAQGSETVFPYTAYIASDDVYVRSGPGQSYYPTEKLAAGAEVEVYRHDPGGWYAIRPPQGSFSWVSGRYLRPGIDNLAVVDVDNLAARVGSRFSDIRDVIQVRLHQAEVVEVLEKKESLADPEDRIWYKIAPPSGEFRWVYGKYVDADYPHDGLRRTRDADPTVVRTGATADGVSSSSDAVSSVSDATEAVRLSSSNQLLPAQRPSTQLPPAYRDPGYRNPAQPLSAGEAVGASYSVRAGYDPPNGRNLTPEQHEAALRQIDMDLSVMVIEEPTVWAFGEMRRRAETLLAQSETALERGRARVLLNKLAQFEDIKRRYDAMGALREETDRANRQLSSLRPEDSRSQPIASAEGRFDGTGELIRVASAKLGAPRYALVDSLGEVVCYVSPAPGVPLAHYLGQRVGVTGTRGYMPEQQTRHVMAQHVSPLDDTRLR